MVHQVVLLPHSSGVWDLPSWVLSLGILPLKISSRCVHLMTGSLMRLLWLLCCSWWHEVVRPGKSPLWGTTRASRASWWAQRASWRSCSASVMPRVEAYSWALVWWDSAATHSSTSARTRERGCCVRHPKYTSPWSHPTGTANLAGERDEGEKEGERRVWREVRKLKKVNDFGMEKWSWHKNADYYDQVFKRWIWMLMYCWERRSRETEKKKKGICKSMVSEWVDMNDELYHWKREQIKRGWCGDA